MRADCLATQLLRQIPGFGDGTIIGTEKKEEIGDQAP
jgi:hypothetical protein